ncbi:helix-turn-helix domain containing protein [Zhouia spongiae]|uniref:Helix-turn-helix domain containing protein n=1 Tax=Zhouia spongiae TaxID=2202721 RepID=A0ABY3YLR0_9FLAO|nr:helix-turn-helix domain-containing protein [Zhouia spongiae]UNY98734.1 helix-turn-helix domain containing protein [Zhouia spongiae]
MKKKTYTKEEILTIVKENKNGKSLQAIAKEFNLDRKTLYYWVELYG